MKTKLLVIAGLCLLVSACGPKQKPRDRVSEFETIDTAATALVQIPYEPKGGHEMVTVSFNGVPMNLMWDTGCTTTTIPITEFQRMIREDKIKDSDEYRPEYKKYARIADGSLMEIFEFNIGTVTFNTIDGKPYELHDVIITVSPNPNSSSLLGKNIIDQLGQYHRNEKETCFVFKK